MIAVGGEREVFRAGETGGGDSSVDPAARRSRSTANRPSLSVVNSCAIAEPKDEPPGIFGPDQKSRTEACGSGFPLGSTTRPRTACVCGQRQVDAVRSLAADLHAPGAWDQNPVALGDQGRDIVPGLIPSVNRPWASDLHGRDGIAEVPAPRRSEPRPRPRAGRISARTVPSTRVPRVSRSTAEPSRSARERLEWLEKVRRTIAETEIVVGRDLDRIGLLRHVRERPAAIGTGPGGFVTDVDPLLGPGIPLAHADDDHGVGEWLTVVVEYAAADGRRLLREEQELFRRCRRGLCRTSSRTTAPALRAGPELESAGRWTPREACTQNGRPVRGRGRLQLHISGNLSVIEPATAASVPRSRASTVSLRGEARTVCAGSERVR